VPSRTGRQPQAVEKGSDAVKRELASDERRVSRERKRTLAVRWSETRAGERRTRL